MRLLQDGTEIKWEAFVQKQSLTDYCASLEVQTNIPIGGVVVVSDGNVEVECVGTSHRMANSKFATVLRPKIFFDKINEIIPPFKGNFTTEEILQQVGFDTISAFKTDKVYWEFPSLPFKEFITHLEMHTQVTNGGGCFINITMDGLAQISDLKTMAERDDITTYLTGDFTQMDSESLWLFDYPGSYHLIQHMPEKTIEREIVFEEDLGKGQIVEIITNENLKDLKVRYLRNRFYRRFYFKHQAQANVVGGNQTYLSAPVRIKKLTTLIAGVVRDNSTQASYNLIF